MNQNKMIELKVTGAAQQAYGLTRSENAMTITDLRINPFGAKVSCSPDNMEVLEISRLFATPIIRHDINKFDDAELINSWMAVVDKYGVDAKYTQEFFDLMEDRLILIAAYGYVADGEDPETALRLFNGRHLPKDQFLMEFFRLIVKYVPSKEVKENNPYTTWAK